MKHLAALTALAAVLALPTQSLAGGMDLKGITASNKSVGTFSSTKDLLPSTPAKSVVSHGVGLQSNKLILSSTFTAADPDCAKHPACPEPASIAALSVGLASVVRRRKANRG